MCGSHAVTTQMILVTEGQPDILALELIFIVTLSAACQKWQAISVFPATVNHYEHTAPV